MICQLCLEEKSLQKKSHIIPDFMFKEIYDEGHWLYRGKMSQPGKMRKVPTSEYEGGILCKECDNNIIGAYETYASRALYPGVVKEKDCPVIEFRKSAGGIELTFAGNIDYRLFKLFMLSILWRASISKRDFFKNVSLGKKHGGLLRLMILNGNPGGVTDYPIFLITHLNTNTVPGDVVGEPHKTKIDSDTRYNFLIGGIYYMFFVSPRNIPDYIIESTINKANELRIFHLKEDAAERFLLTYFGLKRD